MPNGVSRTAVGVALGKSGAAGLILGAIKVPKEPEEINGVILFINFLELFSRRRSQLQRMSK
jgi:hypothetical protein